MRVVVLSSSPYSETSCAATAHLARLGYAPLGALTLPSWDRRTLIRKLGQWGVGESLRYARGKLAPGKGGTTEQVRNPHLEKYLRHDHGVFCNMREVGQTYGFPVVTCSDQNAPRALAQLKQWAPDVAIFAGGNILRQPLLQIPRLGVLNAHLALLPDIRGMSSPEWSLLCRVPLGITIHFMDGGIDTGPILLRREFRCDEVCDSLTELRNRMIAEGIKLTGEVISALDRGTLSAVPQKDRDEDHQYFVMHDALKAEALRRWKRIRLATATGRSDG